MSCLYVVSAIMSGILNESGIVEMLEEMYEDTGSEEDVDDSDADPDFELHISDEGIYNIFYRYILSFFDVSLYSLVSVYNIFHIHII